LRKNTDRIATWAELGARRICLATSLRPGFAGKSRPQGGGAALKAGLGNPAFRPGAGVAEDDLVFGLKGYIADPRGGGQDKGEGFHVADALDRERVVSRHHQGVALKLGGAGSVDEAAGHRLNL
jgi:hypothetical protein